MVGKTKKATVVIVPSISVNVIKCAVQTGRVQVNSVKLNPFVTSCPSKLSCCLKA